jgi:hypothetical protein
MGDLIAVLFQVSFYLGIAGVIIISGIKIIDIALKVFAEVFGLFADVLNKIFR